MQFVLVIYYRLWRELVVSFAFHQAAIPTAVCHLDGQQCSFLHAALPGVDINTLSVD